MADYVFYENYNPVISAVEKDGTQTIGVHDFKSGNRRYIKTSKEKVDEFINERHEKLEEGKRKAGLMALTGTILGLACGKLLSKGAASKVSKAAKEMAENKIGNKGLNEITPSNSGNFFGDLSNASEDFKQTARRMNEQYEKEVAKMDEKYERNVAKMDDGVKTIMGGIFGFFAGAVLGSGIYYDKADEKITQKFIDENK